VVRRLSVSWPDGRPFEERGGQPIRWLVVSDEVDPVLAHEINRAALGPLDAIVGCGDLEPDYLGFLADAFHVPLVFVRGNHDRGGRWEESVATRAPRPWRSGRLHELTGLPVAALEWPRSSNGERRRNEGSAWTDALRIAVARLVGRLSGRSGPLVVVSHAPPRGVGDREADAYHVGFAGYRWLLDRVHPPLWLHGHVPPASVEGWRVSLERGEVVNVTGAVLVEICGPATDRQNGGQGTAGQVGEG
jgi:uncharacterized protein